MLQKPKPSARTDVSHLENLRSFMDSAAENALADRHIAGLSVSVSHRGRVIYSEGHGYANIPDRIRATPSTIYALGSLTKQFTAVAVLQLAERGRLRLEDLLTSHLPLKTRVTSTASIRDVLSHTAGIRGDVERIMLADSREAGPLSRERALALVNDELFDAPAGEAWRYSNLGYYLLGLVIEELTEMSFAEYLDTHVLKPVGMSSTSYGIEDVPKDRLAQGYAEQDGSFTSVDPPSARQTFSSGALFANVLDLQVWTQALHGGRLINERSYREMTSPVTLKNGQHTSYGLGLFLGACGPHRELGHDGTSGGFSAQAAYYPEPALSVVVLMNCERHEAERLEKRISRRLLGVAEPAVRNLNLSDCDLAKYVGTYLHKGLELPVEVEKSHLTISIPNRGHIQLLYQGRDSFIQSDDPSTCFEFVLHSTYADSFVVSREGKTIANARRVF